MSFSSNTVKMVPQILSNSAGRLGDELLVQHSQNGAANLIQLRLHLAAVLLGVTSVVGIALGSLLLLDAGDDAPSRAAAADGVLVRDRKQVAFLDGKLRIHLADSLHVVGHLVIALGLLGELGEVHALVTVGHCEGEVQSLGLNVEAEGTYFC